jgi:hypothetical protein
MGPLLAALFFLVGARAHASSCAADCVRRMAECRAERCTGLPAKLCRDRCRAVTGCRAGGARIRTLATVVTQCQVRDGVWTSRQRLEIKRGDCPATTPMAISTTGVPDPTPSPCEDYGGYRDGASAAVVTPFQRLGVSPDGRTVVFELNTHVADPGFTSPGTFDVSEEGIFAVGPDDTIRRLGPASGEKAYRVFDTNVGRVVTTYLLYFVFSPNGRYVAFSDRGRGNDGSDAAQIVVMQLPKGKRTQVTHFSGSHQGNSMGPDTYAVFLDDDTLGVFGFGEGYFTVRPDGTNLQPIDVPDLGVGGGSIVESFGIAGTFGTSVSATFEGRHTTEPVSGNVSEVFLYGGRNRLLQLTNFGRSDTQSGPSLNTGDRVFFLASANPHHLGKNPNNICQLFSVDRLGNGLRQVTMFKSALASSIGCFGGTTSPVECRVALTAPTQFDARAGTLVFDSTCDPYGLHPVGLQVFAARRDGSGSRQLTSYRGVEGTLADGTLSVELPGPIAASGLKN